METQEQNRRLPSARDGSTSDLPQLGERLVELLINDFTCALVLGRRSGHIMIQA